jgi:hypothetical protein
MLIPPKISIAGIDYEVKYKKDASVSGSSKKALYDAVEKGEDTTELELAVEEESNGLVAHINFMTNEIVMSESLPNQTMDLSFIHELVHGVDFAMGYVPIEDPMEMMALPIDELSVEARAQLMLQVIKQIVDYNVQEALNESKS